MKVKKIEKRAYVKPGIIHINFTVAVTKKIIKLNVSFANGLVEISHNNSKKERKRNWIPVFFFFSCYVEIGKYVCMYFSFVK